MSAAGISQSDWPFNKRAVNGSKLSMRLAHNFDPTAIAPEEQPRNKSAEVKCVALINSRHSRRIVTISFPPENGVRFDGSCLSPGAEKYSNSEVKLYSVLSHGVSEFLFDGFQLVLIT